MKINAKVDVAALADKTDKAQKKLAFSVAEGLNETAKQIQKAQQESLEAHFTLRTKRQFMVRQVAVIKPFASVKQGRLFTDVAVGEKPKLLLAGYEEGIERKPFKGSVIAKPVTGGPARPNFNDPIQDAFKFTKMGLKKVRPSKSAPAKAGPAETRYEGKNGTFTINGVGVFQRISSERGKAAIRMVYAYAKKQKLPAKLGWLRTARTVAENWLSENITQAWLGKGKRYK